ncbi:MAG: elongation factor G [Planctomycetota bacterium]|nr:elongation factor G [Planctomycetota bacterium]
MSSSQETTPAAVVSAGGGDANLSKVRNFGIIAHIDAGKTTTTERVLYYTGKQHKMGDVHEGNTTTDYLKEERERGITIVSAAVSCQWKEHTLNIIDTPGHIDFTAEVQRSLRVLDGACVVFSGVDGVEAQSETVWRQADRFGVPRICFINKMDRVGADMWNVVDQIKNRLGARPLPIQMPVGKEHDYCGVINLITLKQYVFDKDSKGAKVTESDVAPEMKEEADRRQTELFTELADLDEKMGELFLLEQKPTVDDFEKALRRVCIAGKGFPVLCGSAYHYIGVQRMLDAVLLFLPSPIDGKPIVGQDPEDPEKELSRKASAKEPVSALAFKTLNDKFGDLTFVRVYSGTIKKGDKFLNVRRDKKEKVERLFIMHADDREPIEQATAGDICAVGGLKFTYTGDTLCDEDHPILLEPPQFPDTVISMAIEPKTNNDKDKLAHALSKMSKEDPTFTHHFDSETGQLIISGMGELHLEIIKSRMLNEHSVEANVGSPRVSYRETFTQAAEAEGKFVQQSGGRGQYGVCKLRVEPFPNDEEDRVVFEEEIYAGAIPKEFIGSVERGARGAARNGIIAGHQTINVKITLLDGKYHEVDSSDLAFEMAGSIGFKAAAAQAGAILLEPIMNVEVVTPEEYMGNIIGDLNSRRAVIADMTDRGHLKVIKCRVPLAEMFNYSNVSRSLSSGRATFSMEPFGYEAVPRNKYKDIIGDGKEGGGRARR